MGVGFESQWDADWFRARAEQCFRLAAGLTQPSDAEKLRSLGADFEAQAELAQKMGGHRKTASTKAVMASGGGMAGYVRARATSIGLCSFGSKGLPGGFQDGQHGHGSAREAQSAMVGGDVLVVAGTRTQEVAQLVMPSTEPGG